MSALSFALVAAHPSRASLVAGWDFSQYAVSAFPSTDGVTLTGTLSANYSSFDPTDNAGVESAAFGTLFYDGQFGSTNVPLTGAGDEAFLPFFALPNGSLAANLENPFVAGENPFDSLSLLQIEGQPFANFLAMAASQTVSVVFQADLTSILGLGNDWVLSFGGRTLSGTSSVGLAYSTDGSAFTSLSPVELRTSETRFVAPIPVADAQQLFVRMSFAPPNVDGAQLIDNVALNALVTIIPEPSTALLVLAGLAGLCWSGRPGSRE